MQLLFEKKIIYGNYQTFARIFSSFFFCVCGGNVCKKCMAVRGIEIDSMRNRMR